MKSSVIRSRFLSFFEKNKHEVVASSSLIPAQDPTLLFANAGMNQFKDLFLGLESRSYSRAVSIQKCVRAGGKHNDLDNVGFTRRHLTFFEMMGNFSFGDYFKKEAIQFAWDFLTKELGMQQEHMYATVFETDDESYDIWNKEIGLSSDKIYRLGKASNFWQMGDTGPCGPCSEIFIDQGAAFGCADISKCGPDCDCDRFLEIWNLVFMQFDQSPDGTLKPLKRVGVDTGMGLERLCGVLQKKDSVYQTDLFMPIIERIEQLTGRVYGTESALNKAAYHVLADHIRSTTFLIADGCAPSNEGRGYVLRKIIRRAALFAQKLTDKNIFPELSKAVVAEFGDLYPALKENAHIIFEVLMSETKKFSANLVRGTAILEDYLQSQKVTQKITGEQAFVLYDTYGFPVELAVAAAKERGYSVDVDGFERAMAQQKKQSGKKEADLLASLDLGDAAATTFTGYQELETKSVITALVHNGEKIDSVSAGEDCFVIAKESPFFIVGGGQVPDQGWLEIGGVRVAIKQVRYIQTAIAALIEAPIDLKVGMSVTSSVDPVWRARAMKNHTATHLLQGALIDLFGNQIKQSGSLVHPDYLRFDFTYHAPLTQEEINNVENLVNKKIQENIGVNIEYMSLKEATERGALAFFGDKYKPEKVRMVKVDDFSVELCGGTHVHATGDIGLFKIISCTSPSAGHRRIEAVTGPAAVALFQETAEQCKQISQLLKVKQDQAAQAVAKLQQDMIKADRAIAGFKKQIWALSIPAWLQQAKKKEAVPFLIQEVADASMPDLREVANMILQKMAGVCLLFSHTPQNGTVLFCAMNPESAAHISIESIAQNLKEKLSIKGGANKGTLQGGSDRAISAQEFEQVLI